jgi:hypothetical protein
MANDPAMLDVYFSMSTPDSGALRDELTRYIAKHLYRITANLGRVKALVELAQSGFPAGALRTMKEDVLRAAVVFLYATLEDFLRYIGLTYLPSAGEAVLDRIGLIGSSDVLRAEKFFLGKLAKYRVYQADLEDSTTERERNTIPIDANSVREWDDTVTSFISAVIADKIEQDFGNRLRQTPKPVS